MRLTVQQKDEIKQQIITYLTLCNEIQRIVIFGSFIKSENPHDLDIAVFQDSYESYLSLALKYRKSMRSIAQKIPVDVIPLKSVNNKTESYLLSEIESGEIIYERRY